MAQPESGGRLRTACASWTRFVQRYQETNGGMIRKIPSVTARTDSQGFVFSSRSSRYTFPKSRSSRLIW